MLCTEVEGPGVENGVENTGPGVCIVDELVNGGRDGLYPRFSCSEVLGLGIPRDALFNDSRAPRDKRVIVSRAEYKWGSI